MQITNATNMLTGYTMGMKPDGRECIVVVAKATFDIPEPGRSLRLSKKQAPLVMADEFTGEPGYSATLYEVDYAPFKPKCDVLFNGSAYAPRGRTAEYVDVSLSVGEMTKSFSVVGNRHYGAASYVSFIPSAPEPFEKLPFSYDNAWGGCDAPEDDPENGKAFMGNPVGCGYYPISVGPALEGKPLPNTFEKGRPIDSPSGSHKPMALGVVSRHAEHRSKWAGTYDEAWQENVFPFLPRDFDERYYQAAPEDQQIDYPVGGEEIQLVNLSPHGRTSFKLPSIDIPVEFTTNEFDRIEQMAKLDTILIEPDLNRFILVWRTSIQLKKNIFEIPSCVVGRMSRAWYRARDMGKTYYPSLQAVAASNRDEDEDE